VRFRAEDAAAEVDSIAREALPGILNVTFRGVIADIPDARCQLVEIVRRPAPNVEDYIPGREVEFIYADVPKSISADGTLNGDIGVWEGK
jgi:hypothetical protein